MVSLEQGVISAVHKVNDMVSLPERRKCKTRRNL